MVGGSMGTGMETSLRYSGQFKTLRIHAKEKLPLDSKTVIQAHGEIETGVGHPSFLAMSIRRFYPELLASIRVGFEFNKQDKFGYNIRGKKALALTSNGMLGINVKGRCDTDKDFKQRNVKGAVELVWSILDFQKDQDVRVKVGYDLLEKVPITNAMKTGRIVELINVAQRFSTSAYSHAMKEERSFALFAFNKVGDL